MYTVITRRHQDARVEAQPLASRDAAMAVARTSSLASSIEVLIFRNGEADPLCVYRAGARVVCRCEDAAQGAV